MGIILFRILLIGTCTLLGYFSPPFGLPREYAAFFGFIISFLMIILEIKLKKLTTPMLLGGFAGLLLGILLSFFLRSAIEKLGLEGGYTTYFFQLIIFLIFGYLGIVIGIKRGAKVDFDSLSSILNPKSTSQKYKVLDTSAIIDGRIADLCETGFLDSTLVVPHFVLKELQQVADSSDSMKRNRGRRGLDILQKIKKTPDVTVQISELDFPDVEDVDLKLIELAKYMNGKIVTNDFNLNKVAQLRGVSVLNINELANALKPVVLPGEIMRVFILKEGKEFNQGVAYLDDGTMVVVEDAKKLIGKNAEVVVTSVLQTTAGKMIFGKLPAAGNGSRGRRT